MARQGEVVTCRRTPRRGTFFALVAGLTTVATWTLIGQAAATDVPAPPLAGVAPTIQEAMLRRQRWALAQLDSPALAANSEGRSGKVAVGIALPLRASDCLAGRVTCPIVVFLPGFGSAPHAYGPETNPVMRAVDQAVATGRLPPLWVAVVDGRTRLGGGCYVDSATTGQWSTFLATQLVDELQSTLGHAPIVITGHSMGGYGALHVALSRPGVYLGAVAISPFVRASVLTDRLLPVIKKVFATRGPRSAAYVLSNWRDLGFSEKLFWALLAAWAPEPEQVAGVPEPFGELDGEMVLLPNVLRRAAEFDLPNRIAQLSKQQVAQAGRVFVSLGRRDGLTQAKDLQTLQKMWLQSRGGPGRLRVLLHDGNHTSQMGNDLVAGLEHVLLAQIHERRPRHAARRAAHDTQLPLP